MRVLVTGGSGFTGRRVVPRLVAAGHEVAALARSGEAGDRLAALGASPVAGDLDDPASVDDAFARAAPEALVSLASLGFGHAPAVVAAAQEAGVERAVFVSTTGVYTRLDTTSKNVRLGAERLIEGSGLEWSILRPTMIYGAPGDRNMSRLLAALRRTPVFPLPGGGRRLQQPVHVEDLAGAVVAALTTRAAARRSYDVAGPTALTFREVVEQAARAVGRLPRLVSVPLLPTIGLVRIYGRLTRSPRITAEQLERLAEDKVFDIGAARRDLGYAPRPFAAGIASEAALLP